MSYLTRRESLILRIGVGVAYVAGSFLLPWQGFLVVTAVLFVAYRILAEAFVLAFAFDILYGAASVRFFHFRLGMTLAVVLIAVAAVFIRRKMLRSGR